MRISALLPGDSPRTEGIDGEHVARLAAVDERLPPILVRRSDLAVVDGRHRLRAARARGEQTIEVEFFEGSDDDAFLRAVRANVTHGLPLSLKDRRAAAARIITSHPHMSDRAIAKASGLNPKAVAGIRACSTAAGQQLNSRLGLDGRTRPLNVAEGRWRAAHMMAQNPNASLREVARVAGISPATASDVKKRIQAGRPPAAGRQSAGGDVVAPAPLGEAPAAHIGTSSASAAPLGQQERGHQGESPPQPASDLVLATLRRDPSLRLREEGRDLLRLLQYNAVAEWSGLSGAVPPHCEELVGRLARQYAEQWLKFAQHLEQREDIVGP
ncbi:transcriptional regulator [Streptomyces sp. NBC_00377]|uniref:ParB N-terminal domain-containing protein n=1 Tax=unclassified Streptomyces TaxID=2593676 RepID=UPI002E22DB29|nr:MULTISPECIES: ParB N-terminal domain-containing protein [unclassified Streptomyces]